MAPVSEIAATSSGLLQGYIAPPMIGRAIFACRVSAVSNSDVVIAAYCATETERRWARVPRPPRPPPGGGSGVRSATLTRRDGREAVRREASSTQDVTRTERSARRFASRAAIDGAETCAIPASTNLPPPGDGRGGRGTRRHRGCRGKGDAEALQYGRPRAVRASIDGRRAAEVALIPGARRSAAQSATFSEAGLGHQSLAGSRRHRPPNHPRA